MLFKIRNYNTLMNNMMYGFKEDYITTEIGQIHFYTMGNGPPVLLLHGYPQCSLMWKETALILSQSYTTIIPDLRGYGNSAAPKGLDDHSNYSKRAMALDMIQIMDHLGIKKFSIVGHDRGGRVGHRLSRDHRDRVKALSVLDICPTLDMYKATNKEFATGYFHWFFLIQESPLPEDFIGKNPRLWLKTCFRRWSGEFDYRDKFEVYLEKFSRKETIHATCEDYRASASIDLIHDKEDIDEKLAIPIQVLWGEKGLINKCFQPLDCWGKYTTKDVQGEALPCGHFIPEDAPKLLSKKLSEFLF